MVTARCNGCARLRELFELPGRGERYCFECSADVATVILLSTEIDQSRRAGEDARALESEVAALASRMLSRSRFESPVFRMKEDPS